MYKYMNAVKIFMRIYLVMCENSQFQHALTKSESISQPDGKLASAKCQQCITCSAKGKCEQYRSTWLHTVYKKST